MCDYGQGYTFLFFFFFQAEDGIRDLTVTGVQTCALPISAMGPQVWKRMRKQLSKLLSQKKSAKRLSKYLVPIKQAQLFLPVAVGDYTDFYSGIHHATNLGKILRPDNPLLPNYKWVPIGYHGRASSVVVSGTQVQR